MKLAIYCETGNSCQEFVNQVLELYTQYTFLLVIPVHFEPFENNRDICFIRNLSQLFNGLRNIHFCNRSLQLCDLCEAECSSFKEDVDRIVVIGTKAFLSIFFSKCPSFFNKLQVTSIQISCSGCLQQPKKILITGVESSGKTTMTSLLSKRFQTSFTYEYGRDYAQKHLNGNDDAYDLEDFFEIAYAQRALEKIASQKANKLVFFDTDIILTQFYCQLFCKQKSEAIEQLIKYTSYDLILFLEADTLWVQDEIRFMASREQRQKYSKDLYQTYCDYGYEPIIESISGSFFERYKLCQKYIQNLIS